LEERTRYKIKREISGKEINMKTFFKIEIDVEENNSDMNESDLQFFTAKFLKPYINIINITVSKDYTKEEI
jgi:hypothetical protein